MARHVSFILNNLAESSALLLAWLKWGQLVEIASLSFLVACDMMCEAWGPSRKPEPKCLDDMFWIPRTEGSELSNWYHGNTNPAVSMVSKFYKGNREIYGTIFCASHDFWPNYLSSFDWVKGLEGLDHWSIKWHCGRALALHCHRKGTMGVAYSLCRFSYAPISHNSQRWRLGLRTRGLSWAPSSARRRLGSGGGQPKN